MPPSDQESGRGRAACKQRGSGHRSTNSQHQIEELRFPLLQPGRGWRRPPEIPSTVGICHKPTLYWGRRGVSARIADTGGELRQQV